VCEEKDRDGSVSKTEGGMVSTKNLLRLIASDRATAIMGISLSMFEQVNLFTNNKEGGLAGAHLIFLVTTAMRAAVERRTVVIMARKLVH
jgi:hypothetical protein